MPWISDMSLPSIKLCLLPLPSEPSSNPFTLSKALRDQPGPSAPRALLAGAHLWTFARANLSALFLHLSLGYFPGSVLTPEGLRRSLCLFLEQHASSQQSTGLPDHVALLTAGTGFPSRGG